MPFLVFSSHLRPNTITGFDVVVDLLLSGLRPGKFTGLNAHYYTFIGMMIQSFDSFG